MEKLLKTRANATEPETQSAPRRVARDWCDNRRRSPDGYPQKNRGGDSRCTTRGRENPLRPGNRVPKPNSPSDFYDTNYNPSCAPACYAKTGRVPAQTNDEDRCLRKKMRPSQQLAISDSPSSRSTTSGTTGRQIFNDHFALFHGFAALGHLQRQNNFLGAADLDLARPDVTFFTDLDLPSSATCLPSADAHGLVVDIVAV